MNMVMVAQWQHTVIPPLRLEFEPYYSVREISFQTGKFQTQQQNKRPKLSLKPLSHVVCQFKLQEFLC